MWGAVVTVEWLQCRTVVQRDRGLNPGPTGRWFCSGLAAAPKLGQFCLHCLRLSEGMLLAVDPSIWREVKDLKRAVVDSTS